MRWNVFWSGMWLNANVNRTIQLLSRFATHSLRSVHSSTLARLIFGTDERMKLFCAFWTGHCRKLRVIAKQTHDVCNAIPRWVVMSNKQSKLFACRRRVTVVRSQSYKLVSLSAGEPLIHSTFTYAWDVSCGVRLQTMRESTRFRHFRIYMPYNIYLLIGWFKL